MIKELLPVSLAFPLLAQAVPMQSEWERIGLTGISLAVTVFIWRYFTSRQDQKDAANILERDRLLKENNALSQQIINLLQEQLTESHKLATGEHQSHTILENTTRHPVPVRDVS